MTDDVQVQPSPPTVQLGDVVLPRIGLGTNRLTTASEHVRFITEAAAAGIRMIDTAHLYTGGQSEAAIGEARASLPAGCVIATKGGYAPGEGRPDALRAQIDESLRRLHVDTIDLYYLHRVDPQTPLEESMGAIRDAVDAGKIRHAGVSAVTVEQVERARAVVPIAAVQNHHNLRERSHDEVIDHCAAHGIVFVPYFPLRDSHPALEGIARAHAATASQVTLAWLLRRSPVTLPIPGTLSVAHVRENLRALELALSDDEYEALSAPGA